MHAYGPCFKQISPSTLHQEKILVMSDNYAPFLAMNKRRKVHRRRHYDEHM